VRMYSQPEFTSTLDAMTETRWSIEELEQELIRLSNDQNLWTALGEVT